MGVGEDLKGAREKVMLTEIGYLIYRGDCMKGDPMVHDTRLMNMYNGKTIRRFSSSFTKTAMMKQFTTRK